MDDQRVILTRDQMRAAWEEWTPKGWVAVVPTDGPLAHQRFTFPRTAAEIHADEWAGHYMVERVVRWIPDRAADSEERRDG
jgi:hypothetical protein